MSKRRLIGVVFAGGLLATAVVHAAAQTAARKPAYRAPRTAWGAPDIHGDYTNKDEANTPLERPQQIAAKDPASFSEAELAQLAKDRAALAQRIAGGIGGAETGAGPTHWYDHLGAKGSRAWFITDPPDGQMPPMKPHAQSAQTGLA